MTQQLATFVRESYGLDVRAVARMPDRAHAEADVYRVDCDDAAYFLKLAPDRSAAPSPLARFLADAGLSRVVAPLRASDGQLSTRFDGKTATIFPFVDGENAFRKPLTEGQWTALGELVRAVHEVELPLSVREAMRHERYSDVWRDRTREYLTGASFDASDDAVVRALAQLIASHESGIAKLVDHAEQLAAPLRGRSLPAVPCHGDLHAGNVLVQPGGAIAIVDWDDPVLAPRERDLMFVGAGIGGAWNRPEESAAFYRGYGPATVDAAAIAYYRCERIVEDVAVFCEQLLDLRRDEAERAVMFRKLAAAFEPNDVVEIAERTFAAL